MKSLIPNKKIRNEFSDLVEVDITSIISFFIFAIICAYVFLEVLYETYVKTSALKLSIFDYLAEFKERQRLQLAGFSQ